MDVKPRYYLIWKEVTDRNFFERDFPDKESLNDFLESLNSENVVYVKIISGFTLEERYG